MEAEDCTEELRRRHVPLDLRHPAIPGLQADPRTAAARAQSDRQTRREAGVPQLRRAAQTFDEAALGNGTTYHFVDRISKDPVEFTQPFRRSVRRTPLRLARTGAASHYGWDYRRAAYRHMADTGGQRAVGV